MEPPVVVSTSCRRTGRRDDGVEEFPALRCQHSAGGRFQGSAGRVSSTSRMRKLCYGWVKSTYFGKTTNETGLRTYARPRGSEHRGGLGDGGALIRGRPGVTGTPQARTAA